MRDHGLRAKYRIVESGLYEHGQPRAPPKDARAEEDFEEAKGITGIPGGSSSSPSPSPSSSPSPSPSLNPNPSQSPGPKIQDASELLSLSQSQPQPLSVEDTEHKSHAAAMFEPDSEDLASARSGQKQ